jgi:hypothetical protein
MKSALALAAALFGTLAASPAFADDSAAATSVTASTSADSARKGVLQVQFEMMPVGTLSLKGQFGDILVDGSTDTALAGGVSARLEYDVLPFLSVGASPRIIFNVKGEHDTDSVDEVDLRARVTGHYRVLPGLEVFGFVAPGYSLLLPKTGTLENYPRGFSVGAGAGVNLDVTKNAFVSLEGGYQMGFQKFQDADIDLTTDYLHVGLGVGTRF